MPSSNLSQEARDKIIRTIMGEAGGEPAAGMQAVAWVIKNRYDRKGGPGRAFAKDLLTPDQFNALDPKSPAYAIASLPDSHPLYQRVGAIVDNVFDGNIPDPTKGATHYFNPRDASPTWASALTNPMMIGGHRFGNDPTFGGSAAPAAGASGGGLSFRPNVVQEFSPELQSNIDALKASLVGTNIPIDVVSGYRDPGHNAAVGGARGSQHMSKNAIDIALRGLSPEQKQTLIDRAFSIPGFRGFGYYPKSDSIHLDVRPGARVAWGSDYTGGSVGAGWDPWLTQKVANWRNAGVLGGGPTDVFPSTEAKAVQTAQAGPVTGGTTFGALPPVDASFSGSTGAYKPATVKQTNGPIDPALLAPAPIKTNMPAMTFETMESPIVDTAPTGTQAPVPTTTLDQTQIANILGQPAGGSPYGSGRTGALSADEQRQLNDPGRYGTDPRILAQLKQRAYAPGGDEAAKLAPLSFGQIGSGPLSWLASLFGSGSGSVGSAGG